jgi:hypothetical protein
VVCEIRIDPLILLVGEETAERVVALDRGVEKGSQR